MVLDSLTGKEQQGLAAAFAIAVTASLAAGFIGGNTMSSPTGAFTGDTVSQSEIRSTAQSVADKQVQRQSQRLSMIAQQSENYTKEDLSINSEVQEISDSEFPSLYKVTISLTGETPTQKAGGETKSIDQEQVIYISKDGKYIFSQPTDLEQLQKSQQQTQGQQQIQPSGGQ